MEKVENTKREKERKSSVPTSHAQTETRGVEPIRRAVYVHLAPHGVYFPSRRHESATAPESSPGLLKTAPLLPNCSRWEDRLEARGKSIFFCVCVRERERKEEGGDEKRGI